jgi:hypothetical protein
MAVTRESVWLGLVMKENEGEIGLNGEAERRGTSSFFSQILS